MNSKGRLNLKKWQIICIILMCLCIFGIIIFSTIYFKLDNIIEKNIRSQSHLEPGTQLYEKWTDIKYAMETRIWTYSVKNPDAIINSTKPILKSTGPYVFDQVHKRHVHSFVNSTLSYETIIFYHFNENKSCEECYLYNRVWIPNMIYQKFVEAASKPAMKAATAALLVQTPFLEVEVSEMLFEGYIDPFLDQVCNLPFVNFVCESILDLPERIGFFFGKNGSSSGNFEINTGHENEDKLGEIITWQGQNKVPESWWNSEDSSKIYGTDGTLFHPYLKKDEKLSVFVKDLCRSIDLIFKEEIDYKGIKAYRYVLSPSDLDTTLPENKGFCYDNKKRFYDEQPPKCLPKGLLDISRCQKGEPPIIFSLPNFLFTPQYVQDSIEGMDIPDFYKDEVLLDLEPRLGSLFRAYKRSQINVAMWKGGNISLPGLKLENFHSTIVPVLKIEDYIEMDEETFQLIKEQLVDTENLVRATSIIGIIVAIILGLLVLFYFLYKSGILHKKHTVSQQKENNIANGNYS